MLLAHKIRCYPTPEQHILFTKACGISRFVYNWALDQWIKQYEAGLKPNKNEITKQLNSIKDIEFPWMSEISSYVGKNAIKNLGTAFDNFFRNLKLGRKPGFPKFKKKFVRDSFRIDNGLPFNKHNLPEDQRHAVNVKGKIVYLPRMGNVKLAEEIRFSGSIRSATVSRTATHWYISFLVDTNDILKPDFKYDSVGGDLGIRNILTLSKGIDFKGIRALKALLHRVKLLSKSLSRKIKGSSNWKKAKAKLSELHKRISNIRKDYSHKMTTYLAKTFKIICLEDLAVSEMCQNKKFSFSLYDVAFGEINRQIEYKSKMTGSIISRVDRYFPSSKLCCICGKKHRMPLSQEYMSCSCGNKLHRDKNASINIEKEGIRKLAEDSLWIGTGMSVVPVLS